MTDGLPHGLSASVAGALSALGRPGTVSHAHPVGGGCIHNGWRVETESGEAYFLKWNHDAPPGMFAAEADGLKALGAVGAAARRRGS